MEGTCGCTIPRFSDCDATGAALAASHKSVTMQFSGDGCTICKVECWIGTHSFPVPIHLPSTPVIAVIIAGGFICVAISLVDSWIHPPELPWWLGIGFLGVRYLPALLVLIGVFVAVARRLGNHRDNGIISGLVAGAVSPVAQLIACILLARMLGIEWYKWEQVGSRPIGWLLVVPAVLILALLTSLLGVRVERLAGGRHNQTRATTNRST